MLRNSNEFSLEKIRNHLMLLSKILLVCSSTLIYITVSSLFVSSYLVYLKNQLINVHLNNLSVGMNLTANNNEIITDLKSTSNNNNNSTISLDQENDDIFSIENDNDEDLLINNQTFFGKQQTLCFNSNSKLSEIGFSLYKLFEINRKSIEYRNDFNQNELSKRQKNLNFMPLFDHSQHNLMNRNLIKIYS